MALGVVEHRGPLDAGHGADDKRQFLLRRHPQQFTLHRPALPRAVFLEGTAEAAAKLPRQCLGIDQRPHVGALPAAWHPDPAAVGAMVGELGPIEGRLHDRHLGRRECHAGEQFDLFTRWPVAQQPASPADRRGDESQRDDLRRRDGQRQAVAGRWRGLLCVHALPFVTGERKRLEKRRIRCVSTRRNDQQRTRWQAGGLSGGQSLGLPTRQPQRDGHAPLRTVGGPQCAVDPRGGRTRCSQRQTGSPRCVA